MDGDASQAATALLTEHLQYTPLSLIDDIIDSVNNFVYQGVGSLETGLFATPPERLGFRGAPTVADDAQSEKGYTDARQEIEEGLHKLETLLNSTVDKNFDKFEIYVLRNILSVPPELVSWTRLSHYEGIQYPPQTNAPTPETIQLLRKRLAASRSVDRALQQEQQRNETILAQLKTMTAPGGEPSQMPDFSFLIESPSAQRIMRQSEQPLTTTTTFTMSQLPALKAVLSDLRSKLASLHRNIPMADTAKDEYREERRKYIEQRTRAHLERSGQLLADDTGAVASGSVDIGEIEALEKVVGIFHPT